MPETHKRARRAQYLSSTTQEAPPQWVSNPPDEMGIDEVSDGTCMDDPEWAMHFVRG